jgi:hypothetical protein
MRLLHFKSMIYLNANRCEERTYKQEVSKEYFFASIRFLRNVASHFYSLGDHSFKSNKTIVGLLSMSPSRWSTTIQRKIINISENVRLRLPVFNCNRLFFKMKKSQTKVEQKLIRHKKMNNLGQEAQQC